MAAQAAAAEQEQRVVQAETAREGLAADAAAERQALQVCSPERLPPRLAFTFHARSRR